MDRNPLLRQPESLQFTFHMEAKSVITYPSGGQRLKAQGFHEISGLAWTGRGRVARVEVSVDGGKTWHDKQGSLVGEQYFDIMELPSTLSNWCKMTSS